MNGEAVIEEAPAAPVALSREQRRLREQEAKRAARSMRRSRVRLQKAMNTFGGAE